MEVHLTARVCFGLHAVRYILHGNGQIVKRASEITRGYPLFPHRFPHQLFPCAPTENDVFCAFPPLAEIRNLWKTLAECRAFFLRVAPRHAVFSGAVFENSARIGSYLFSTGGFSCIFRVISEIQSVILRRQNKSETGIVAQAFSERFARSPFCHA